MKLLFIIFLILNLILEGVAAAFLVGGPQGISSEVQPATGMWAMNYGYDRPDECRHYPVKIDQMIRDECEMLEARDLASPKRAQRTLDELMADSRPPVSE